MKLETVVNTKPFLTKTGTYKQFSKWREEHPNRYQVKNVIEFNFLVRTLFKEIADAVHTCNGGVTIDNFGYMYVFRSPNKVMFKNHFTGEYFMNMKRNGRMIRPIFIASRKANSKFKNWSMDCAFAQKVKKKIGRRIFDGGVYKAYPYTVKMLKLI